MTSGECLCSEESSEINTCDGSLASIPFNINDFIEEVQHYKCKVVKLAHEQILKTSRNSQQHTLADFDECECAEYDETTKHAKSSNDTEDKKSSKQIKREVKELPTRSTDDNDRTRRNQLFYVLFIIALLLIGILLLGFFCATMVCNRSWFCSSPTGPRPF